MRYPELRQISVMFVDLVGSTVLGNTLELEDYSELLETYRQTCRHYIDQQQGYLARVVGDGIQVYFGYPDVQEDSAVRALAAASSIRRAVPAITTEHGEPLQVRISVTTGEVLLGSLNDDAQQNETVAQGPLGNLGDRLRDAASPQEIVVDTATNRLADRIYQLEEIGKLKLKGFANGEMAYRLTGERRVPLVASPGRSASPSVFVARRHELQILNARANSAVTGKAGFVVLEGQSGIGKSTLADYFTAWLAEKNTYLARFACSGLYQGSSLAPVLRFLATEINLPTTIDAAGSRRMIDNWSDQLGISPDHSSAVFELLIQSTGVAGVAGDPVQLRALLFEAVIRVLTLPDRPGLTVLIVDDVQWADPSTIEFLNLLGQQARASRLLVIMTARSVPDGLMQNLKPEVLPLTELSTDAITDLIRHEVGGLHLPDLLIERLTKVSQGVPLFAKELFYEMLESGVVERAEDGFVFMDAKAQTSIPTTLRAILEARLGRLAEHKNAAQILSCIGDSFSQELAEHVLEKNRSAGSQPASISLDGLQQHGFLLSVPITNGRRYSFSHNLFQEIAYRSLARQQKRAIHSCIADVLLALGGQEESEITAYHFFAANELPLAIRHYFIAVERYTANGSYDEAIQILDKIEKIRPKLTCKDEKIQTAHRIANNQGVVFQGKFGYGSPETKEAFERAANLFFVKSDKEQLFKTQWGLARLHTVNGRLRDGLRAAEEAHGLALEIGKREQLIEAHLAMGVARLWLGQFSEALSDYQQVEEYYNRQQHGFLIGRYGEDPETLFSTRMAFPLWMLGYPDKALQRCMDGVAAAENVRHPVSRMRAYAFSGWVHQFRGEIDELRVFSQKVLHLANEMGSQFWALCGEMQLAWAISEKGERQRGNELFRRALAKTNRVGTVGRTYHRALLAELYFEAGDYPAAWNALKEAEQAAVKSGDGFWRAELKRLSGVIGAQVGMSPSAASNAIRDSLYIASDQQARSLELRAASALHTCNGYANGESSPLQSIYESFDEGYESRDLKRAAALQTELFSSV